MSDPSHVVNTTQKVVDLRAVTKVYGEGESAVRALHSADLSVSAGEVVAIMGPSGSGKSTLLTIAGGLEKPTSGHVTIEGVDITQLKPAAQARLRRKSIGFVFQEFNLMAGLTALENVAMPLELDGRRSKDAQAEAKDALALVGIGERRDHFPDDLSGGERQRVAIARALIGDKRLLLADEPTGALDSANGEEVMRVLRSTSARGAAVVIVTHDAHLASWADRIVFIRDGKVSGESVANGPERLLSEVGGA